MALERKRLKRDVQSPFIAKVEIPFELELLPSRTVYVLCAYTTEWDLAVIDEIRLQSAKHNPLPDVVEHAVPFTLGEHSLESNLPEISEINRKYADLHLGTIQKCTLVAISGTSNNGWFGAGFFHPTHSTAIQQYIARMRKEYKKLPLIARGALFHWVMLRMAGYAATDATVDFTLVDMWKGWLKLSKDEQQELTAEVEFASKIKVTERCKEWLANGTQKGIELNSYNLETALTPDKRARLWLYVQNKKDILHKEVEAYAMKDWPEDASDTHAHYKQEVNKVLAEMTADYDAFTEKNTKLIQKDFWDFKTPDSSLQLRLANAFVGAMYINKRIQSIEEKKKK